MLYKAELERVPLLPVPMKKAKSGKVVAAQVVELKKSGSVLVCDFVVRGSRTRFFTDGNTYQTLAAGTQTFSQRYPYNDYSYEETEGSLETVCNFLGEKEHSVVWAIRNFVSSKKREKSQKAYDRKWELQKQHFAMYPDYPANLGTYCEDNVFQHGYMFVFKKDKQGGRYGKCSHCGKRVLLDSQKQPTGSGVCPKCGHRVQYKQAWQKAQIIDREKLCITHKVNGQLLIRWVDVTRTYTRPSLKENFTFEDYGYNLHLSTTNGNILYCYKLFNACYSYWPEWHRLKNGDIVYDKTYIYTDNLREVFGEKYYNVDLQAGLAGRPCKLSFAQLLNNLRDNPIAEYLFKLGLPIIAANAGSLIAEPTGNGAFYRALGVSKQYLPMYRDMCVTMNEHRIIKASKQFVHPEELQALRDFGLSNQQLDTAAGLMQTMTISKFIKYMTVQQAVKRKRKYSLNQLMVEYRDYISMSKDLGVDLSHKSVRYPADIAEAHKVITDRYNQCKAEIERKKNAEIDQQFQARVQELYAKFGITEFEADGYRIVLPQLRSDLIVEGQSLNHCVGQSRYYANHLAGTSMIFFLRKASEPERPYFTMELDMCTFRIQQLYGFGDCSAPKDVRAFAEKFAARLKRAIFRKTA